MLNNGIIGTADKQSGFSLIELMVAIVLGLLITAAVTAMTVNNLKMSGNTLKSARLNQDLGAVMQIMVNEIRRAGYGSGIFHTSLGSLSAPGDIVLVDLDGDSSNGAECILYRYDANDNDDTTGESTPPSHTEKRGFRITGTSIEMATRDADDCDGSDGWESLTDPDVITITALEIDSANSKCHHINESISIRSKIDTTTATDKPPTKFACIEDDFQHIERWWEGDPAAAEKDWKTVGAGPWPLKTYTTDSTVFTRSVGVRHVNISLKGVFNDPFVETGSDYDEYPIKKSLDVSIKVRNDHVYEISPE